MSRQCPYCGSFCNNDAEKCYACQSILPPPGYVKARYTAKPNNDVNEIYEKINQSKGVSFASCFAIDKILMADECKIRTYNNINLFFNDLYESISTSGIGIEKKDFLLIFSALCSGRIVHLSDLNIEKYIRLFERINECFSTIVGSVYTPVIEEKGGSSIFGRLEENASGDALYTCTPLLDGIYTANAIPTPFVQLVKADTEQSISVTDFFIRAYAEEPDGMHRIPQERLSDVSAFPKYWSQDGLHTSRNLWFIYLSNAFRKPFDIYPAINISDYEEIEENHSNLKRVKIDNDNFINLCLNAKKDNFLSENMWRKIDDIEKYIQTKSPDFYFENALLRNMESFSSVYMSCGGTEKEALDALMTAYLMPIITDITQNDAQSLREFRLLIESLFDGIEFPHSNRYIDKNITEANSKGEKNEIN